MDKPDQVDNIDSTTPSKHPPKTQTPLLKTLVLIVLNKAEDTTMPSTLNKRGSKTSLKPMSGAIWASIRNSRLA
ncbi:putative uncharacterized protein [Helicobacter felis ATCC 49179]|uniref:Uncharacterized protein n=1 Tax=Helicobacter felis (strain ATCC 49179 / CCUG 28539 / NCTC 12436 / CS1) TaxID=936155 RepID=E7A8U3_HELFC|nr:putative uncharacterized protein [Helicobacter felis ATCC 49179]